MKLTDEQVRKFLEDRSKELSQIVSLEQLGKLVQQKLRMNTRNRNATARMQNLFTIYHTLLVQNGLEWLIMAALRA